MKITELEIKTVFFYQKLCLGMLIIQSKILKMDEVRNQQSNSSQPFVARLMMRLLGAKTEIQYQPLGTIGMINHEFSVI